MSGSVSQDAWRPSCSMFSNFPNPMTEARPWILETQQRGRMGYMHVSVKSLYNPSAFRNAGIADPYGAGRSVRVDPTF
jgi:hypothetical protein